MTKDLLINDHRIEEARIRRRQNNFLQKSEKTFTSPQNQCCLTQVTVTYSVFAQMDVATPSSIN